MSQARKNKPKVIVILGPTASGKSDLAIKIALKFNGQIISADSRQVYKGLDIGTGKVTKAEQKLVKHYLLDVCSPKKIFTVVDYQRLAKKALDKILADGKIPIICGGTGFYIDTLIYDLKFPEVAPNAKLRKRLEKYSAEKLYQILKKLDPLRAETIDKKNKRRLIRAIEIIKGGKTISEIKKKSPYQLLKIGIKRSREELKKRIIARLDKRLAQGLISEVKNLHRQGLSYKKMEQLGLEYRWVARYLQKKIDYQQMRQNLINKIYQYSKRQMTWFKRDKQIHWITSQSEAFQLVKKFLEPDF